MNALVEKPDALFVIHQDADLEKIRRIIKNHEFQDIFILTTHLLLKKEQQEMENLAPRVRTTTLASLLTDAEMADCDRRATDELLLRLTDHRIQRTYMRHFINQSLWHKNAMAWKKLKNAYCFENIYFSPGLGIHPPFWTSIRGESLETAFNRYKRYMLPHYARKIRNLFKKRNVYSICHQKQCYLFVSTLARLKFSDNGLTKKDKISRFKWLLVAFTGRSGLSLLRNLVRDNTPAGYTPILCATIHNYQHMIGESGLPLLIFVDGYHPSNYPRSYLDMYTYGRFVVGDMIAEVWFKKHGKETLKPPPFIKSAKMLPIKTGTEYPLKHILLALNHAGDWTSLINRSDTDLLVETFCRTAQLFPDIHFTVRPHPTMAEPEHEGINSLNRINMLIKEKALSNLTVSQGELSADLQKTQLVLSEYSQVLIDAYQMGKPGLVVNLTGRRSFMEDYEKTGFPAVHSEEELNAWIQALIQNPDRAVFHQNRAVENYNQRLMAAGYVE